MGILLLLNESWQVYFDRMFGIIAHQMAIRKNGLLGAKSLVNKGL